MLKRTLNGTLLGFDFGLKRIGIATGHTQTALAHPHSTLKRSEDPSLTDEALIRLVREWKPVALIVGYPTHADGRITPHPLQPACLDFAHVLSNRFSLPVALVDEQLSSYAAEQHYRQQHGTAPSKRDKAALDAYAAQQILQDFLEGATPHLWVEPSSIS